ncbi:MAG: hypothetical protein U1F43_07715 [Myxococcota bacterium]
MAFAGRVLRLRLTPDLAAAIHLDAFARPPIDPATGAAASAVALTIDLWDARSARLEAPEPGRTAQLVVGRNSATAGSARVTWEPPFVWGFDTATGHGHWYCDDPAALATLSRGQPFLRMLHEWTQALGLRVLHGAAVGRHGRGILLTAPGGSGKSTLALAAQLAGWDYVGDDYVALEPAQAGAGDGPDAAPRRPRVHGTYAVAKLVPDHMMARLPAIAAARLAVSDGVKALLAVPLTPLPDGLALAALVVPHIAPDGVTRRLPMSPGRALTALAPSTLFQLPGAGRADLAPLAALVRALPVWGLALGPDLGEALAVLGETLAEAAP